MFHYITYAWHVYICICMQRNHIYGIGYTLGRNAKIRMYSIYNDTNLTKLDVHVILFPSSWQSVKSKSRLESQVTEKTLAPRFRLPRHAVLTVPAGKGKIIVVRMSYTVTNMRVWVRKRVYIEHTLKGQLVFGGESTVVSDHNGVGMPALTQLRVVQQCGERTCSGVQYHNTMIDI